MLKIHQTELVLQLRDDQLAVVWRDLTARYPDFPSHPEPTNEILVDLLRARRVDHAALLTPMLRETTPLAVSAIEQLLGKPITRASRAPARATFNGRAPRPRVADHRVISQIQPNPKKPGSASHARFALYREGMTVSEALAAGVTTADVRWDSERGFICLS